MAGKTRETLARYIAGEDVSLDDASIKEVMRGDADEARQFVAGEVAADELDLHPDVAIALIDALVETQNGARLGELAARGDKAIIKEARRGVHRLKAKGIDVPVDKAPAKKLTAASDAPEAWAAPPDGAGERLVAIIIPAVGRGFHVIYVHVSDQTGLIDVVTAQGPKKLWRTLKKRFDDKRLLFAPVETSYAARLVEEAYERTVAIRRTPPKQFPQIRGLVNGLRSGGESGEHPALSVVPMGTAPDPAQARALHDLPELRGWVLTRESIRELSRKFEEIQSSQLYLDDRQRVDARRRAMDEALKAAFDDTGRRMWIKRLLDAAYVYFTGGHREEASRMRALAERIQVAEFDPTTDPFTRLFVDKLVSPDLLGEGPARAPVPPTGDGDEPKLIVTP